MTNLFSGETLGKLDPDPHLSENLRALEVQNGAVEADEAHNNAWPLK
jgi:hypothetical protein